MSDSSQDLQIKITSTADTTGAKEMTKELKEVRTATEEAGKASDAISNVSLRNLLQGMKAARLGGKEFSELLKGDFTNATGMATVGLKALNAAAKAGPIGLLAAAVSLAIPALISLFTSASSAAKSIDDVGGKSDEAKPKLEGVGTAGDSAAKGMKNASSGASELVQWLQSVTKEANEALAAINSLEAAKLKAEQAKIKGQEVTGQISHSEAMQAAADAEMKEGVERNNRDKNRQAAIINTNADSLGAVNSEIDKDSSDAASMRAQAQALRDEYVSRTPQRALARQSEEDLPVLKAQLASEENPDTVKELAAKVTALEQQIAQQKAADKPYNDNYDTLLHGSIDPMTKLVTEGADQKDADVARLKGQGKEIQKGIDTASHQLDVLDQEAQALTSTYQTKSGEATKEAGKESEERLKKAQADTENARKLQTEADVAALERQTQAAQNQITSLEQQQKGLGNGPEGMKNVEEIANLKLKIIDLDDAKKKLQGLLTAEQQQESQNKKVGISQNESNTITKMGQQYLQDNPPPAPPPPKQKLFDKHGRQLIDGHATESPADKKAHDGHSPSGTDFSKTFPKERDTKLPEGDTALPQLDPGKSPSGTDFSGTFKKKEKPKLPLPFHEGGGTNNNYGPEPGDAGDPGDEGATGQSGGQQGPSGGGEGMQGAAQAHTAAAQTQNQAAQTFAQAGTQMQTAATQFASTANGLNTGLTQLLTAVSTLSSTVAGMGSKISQLQATVNRINSDVG